MLMLASIALWVCCANTHAGTSRANPFDALPYHSPKELQGLVKLDDTQLQARINTDWNKIRETLDRFYPAGLALTPHRAFAGPQQACLQNRSVAACRIYMRDLIEINKQKEQQGGSLLLNPWGSTPR
jgi:hypothetical protein